MTDKKVRLFIELTPREARLLQILKEELKDWGKSKTNAQIIKGALMTYIYDTVGRENVEEAEVRYIKKLGR